MDNSTRLAFSETKEINTHIYNEQGISRQFQLVDSKTKQASIALLVITIKKA
jgi:hypothetical protein